MSKLIHGDNIEVLKQFADNSVDAMVTDPPFGFAFMNKKWDYDVPSVATFRECLRVLKPGAHILVCCGTRTQHRMAVNIEDAGFEIRDILCHHFGSGFPKNLNISKAIDREADADRKVVGVNKYDGYGTALKPSTEFWTLARKPISEDTIVKNILKWGTGAINIDDCRISTGENISNHSRSAESAISKGKYGDSTAQQTPQTHGQKLGRFPANLLFSHTDDCYEQNGQWICADACPVKIIDEQAPETGAYAMVKPGIPGTSKGIYGDYENKGSGEDIFYDDGLLGASRFFYVAKPSRSERNAGVSTKHQTGHLVELAGKGAWHCIDCGRKYNYTAEVCPKCGSDNRILYGVGSRPIANTHVTVKPITLMRYLIKMVVPKNGIVLDPFAGSGTTGCAALMEQRDFILIEKEKEYFEITTERIAYWGKEAMIKNQPSLFDTLL